MELIALSRPDTVVIRENQKTNTQQQSKSPTKSKAWFHLNMPQLITMNIKFEVGKHYRTASGKKVRIVALDSNPSLPVVGVIAGECAGAWGVTGCNPIQSYRIISEWIDKPSPPWAEVPKWFNWFAADDNGRQFYYPKKPTTSGSSAWLCISFEPEPLEIPIPHRIPVTCDWKDSLVERPTV
jgi:hypothetical protein